MAEIEKQNELPEEEVETEEVDVEVEGEEELPEQEAPEEDFYRNLAEDMDDRVLGRIAQELISDFKKDKVSRGDWEQAYTQGLDLLGFKYVNNTRPFQGASGVTHPLLSEAVTQFQAQAYKELLPSDGPVRTAVIGADTTETQQQAERVKDFMNYMLMEEMEEYTPDTDQMLFYLPLAGSAFKKIYYDEIKQRAVSKFVPAEDLIVPYYATDLKDCERITHVVKMSENDVLKQQKAGFYRDVELIAKQAEQSPVQDKLNELEGVKPAGEKEYQYNILEMHIDLNINQFEKEDAEKEVKLPYIVSIDEGTGEVLSTDRQSHSENSSSVFCL